MSLITKRKTPSFTEQAEPMAGQDPLIQIERLCEEASTEIDREEAFRRTLDAALRPTVEEHRRVEKAREAKARFWLTKMAKPGDRIDWDALVARMRKRDPRSAALLEDLVASARELGALED